jgi:NADH-quinone oxidoreductase subunit J
MLTDILSILGCIAVLAGGFIVLAASNPTRSLLGLFLTSISLGFLYLLLGGSLVATVQIVVYAGAVLMLFLFVVRYFVKKLPRSRLISQFPSALIVVVILFSQILVPLSAWLGRLWSNPDFTPPDPSAIGTNLFTGYVYAFELVTVLLLVSVVGALYMARAEISSSEDDKEQ